ncbi:MAG: ABC transporter permease [Chloroflexota bacterium]
MMRFNPDRVALTGSIIGLISIFLGWLTLKPNRLAVGTSMNLWESTGGVGAIAITILWLLCLFLSLAEWKTLRGIALGISANFLLILSFWLVGLGSSHLIQGETAIARVSLGAGFWLTLIGTYTVIFAARQKLDNRHVWRQLVSWSGLAVFMILISAGWLNHLSILQEYNGYRQRFGQEFWQHIRLFGGSVIIATLIGIPLGIWATRSRYAEGPVFFTTNIVQTIPSLALFGLLIAPLSALSFSFPVLRDIGIRGVGVAPAIIALTIYALLPIVRNTYVGIRQVEPSVIDAGQGMGMSRWQIFRRVEIPLAAPLVFEGVRTASVQAVGLTTVAALIGAGGFGWFVFQGIGQAAPDLIILGAIPVIILALLVDALMRTFVKLGTPKGLSRES